jgi:hypothetical protein
VWVWARFLADSAIQATHTTSRSAGIEIGVSAADDEIEVPVCATSPSAIDRGSVETTPNWTGMCVAVTSVNTPGPLFKRRTFWPTERLQAPLGCRVGEPEEPAARDRGHESSSLRHPGGGGCARSV